MKNKLFLVVLLFTFITAGLSFSANVAQADLFPAGCSSAIGNSVSTGLPCNGSSVPTQPIAGCSSPIGYSVTTGTPCSGTTFAIQYLGGCSSLIGYSTATGAPCNGTSVATPPLTLVITNGDVTPGLPTTGAGGQAAGNVALLLLSGAIVMFGSRYAVKHLNTK